MEKNAIFIFASIAGRIWGKLSPSCGAQIIHLHQINVSVLERVEFWAFGQTDGIRFSSKA